MTVADAFGDEPALIAYLTAGDPSLAATKRYVDALVAGGADAIELGVPFSEPIAEGPTIQRAILRALDAGTTPDSCLELAAELDVDVPVLAMTYYNLLHQYGVGTGRAASGVDEFARTARESGLDGVIVPDLPVEESGPLRDACGAHDLDVVHIVAPTTRGDRVDAVMNATSGFAYVQARLGTTGEQRDVSDALADRLRDLAGYDVPKAVGFGIGTGEQAARVAAAGADGVIVGSAFVDVVADHGDAVESATRELESLARELKEGAVAGAAQSVPKPERT